MTPRGTTARRRHSQRVISCLDDKQRPTPEETKKRLRRVREDLARLRRLPGLGHGGLVPRLAGGRPVRRPRRSARREPPRSWSSATPGDPATPYEGARKMADELGKGVGVELTWKGEGHGAYGSGSDCVDSTVNGYLLDGTVPRTARSVHDDGGGPAAPSVPGTPAIAKSGPLSCISRRHRPVRAGDRSVDRLVRLDLVDPADHAAADVHGVREARGLQDREDFRTADTRLAVQDDLLVLREASPGRCP